MLAILAAAAAYQPTPALSSSSGSVVQPALKPHSRGACVRRIAGVSCVALPETSPPDAPSPLSSTLSSYVDGLKCPNPSAGEPSSITSYIQSLEETSPLLTGTASTLTDYICDLIEEGSAAAPPITSLTSYVEAVEAELPEEIEPSVSVPGSSLSSYIENVEELADDAAEDDAEDDAPCGSLSCYLDELDERCDPFA